MQQNHKPTSKKTSAPKEKKQSESLLTEIDHEAKREWKNAIKFQHENHWLFTGFVMLLAALVIINTIYVISAGNQLSSPKHDSDKVIQTKPRIYTSLQIATTPDFEARVSNVTENATHDPAFTFADDETMLILDLSIKNNTSAIQHIIPTSQLFVHDRDGGLYKVHPSMHITSPLDAQDIQPGETATGQIGFAVPQRQTQPLLYIDLGWSNQAPAVFDILH